MPLLTDFGLARRLDDSPSLTTTGAIVGTPSYMSPEQASGEAHLSTAVDVYGLGAILYELLTGRPPFQAASTLETLLQVRSDEPAPPRLRCAGLDIDLETICMTCLHKAPEKRYGSAEALADDLERWLTGRPIRARRVGPAERLVKWARRRPAAAAAYGLLLLVGVLAPLGAGATWLWRHSEGQHRETAKALRLAEKARDEADRERGKAEQSKREADLSRKREMEAKDELALVSYYHKVNLASQKWGEGQLGQVLRLLDDCPAHLRGWEWRYVKGLCHTELLTLHSDTGQGGHGIAFSPDGQSLAVADGYFNTATLWDAETGKKRHTLHGHQGPVSSVALSGDGKLLATASADRTVKLWSTASGALVRTMSEHEKGVNDVVFSPDGKELASASDDGTLRVWETATGRPVRVLKAGAELHGVAWSPDGKRLATGDVYGEVCLWDAPTGAREGALKNEKFYGRVRSLAFSPDARVLVASSADTAGTIRVWAVGQDKGEAALSLQRGMAHGHYIWGMALSPDGELLATGAQDTTIKVWSTKTGQLLNVLRGHTATVNALAFAPDGKRLASVGHDRAVKLWSPTAPQEANVIPLGEFANEAAFSDDGQRLVVGGGYGVVLIDVPAGRAYGRFPMHKSYARSITRHPDGARIAVAEDRLVILRDLQTGKVLKELAGHTAPITCLRCSRDGKRLVSASEDGSVRVWDGATGRPALVFKRHGEVVRDVAISPDGAAVASAGHDNHWRVWDPVSGKERWTYRANGHANSVAFSADGKWLAGGTAGEDLVRIFDAADGRVLHACAGHNALITRLCFSPDGTRLASASFDKTVKLWDTRTGHEVLTLKGHTAEVVGVAFSPDGRRLATCGGWDQTVRVWDVGPSPAVFAEIARLDLRRLELLRQPAGPPPKQGMARPIAHGEWSIDGNEIVQKAEHQGPTWLFLGGGADWRDYDVEVEVQRLGGHDGAAVAFRMTDVANHYLANVGGWGNKQQGIEIEHRGNRGLLGKTRPGGLETGRWYRVRVEVRGDRFRCLLDGQTLLEARDARHARGVVALRSWGTHNRWRKLRVTAPDGKVLFAGLPVLEPPALPGPDERARLIGERMGELLMRLKE
jgi:WD40 repeat protein